VDNSLKSKEMLLEEIEVLKHRIAELEKNGTVICDGKDFHEEDCRWFSSLVEAAGDWIWEVNADSLYTYASPRVKDFLGYSPEEIIGKNPFDFMQKEDAARVLPIFTEIADKRQTFSRLENINIHKDGHEVILETNGVPFFDKTGKYAGYRGFDRDITERKRMQESLRTAQIRLSEAMDLAGIVYWDYDAQKREFVFNDAFYEFYGTTAEKEGRYSMTGEEYARRFIHPDDLNIFSECIKNNLSRPDLEFTDDIEHRIIRRDGQVRHVLARIMGFKDNAGNFIRAYGANQDITEQKKAEEQREKLIVELKDAASQIKTLTGLLPVCSYCKKIRDDEGNWELMEKYIRRHSEADFSHGVCPECLKKYFPDIG